MNFQSFQSRYFPNRRLSVDLLVICFGISCWVSINGLWTQTPILTNQLPEKWNLASYIVVIIQLANIGPILFGLFRKKLKRYEGFLIHLTMAIGVAASILLAIFWKVKVKTGGDEHSIPFLVLTGFLALVDCTSSVLFLPFMANFDSKYLISFFIGEGFSSLLPSFISFFQGVGGNAKCEIVNGTSTSVYPEPQFSTSIFCVFLAVIMVISWISFAFLNSSFSSSELAGKNSNEQDETTTLTEPTKNFELTDNVLRYLLLIQAVISSFTNGILSSLQSYSCAPYGTLAYSLAVKLSGYLAPICAFLAFYYKSKINLRFISMCAFLGFAASTYAVILATLSPTPPLAGSALGGFMLIITWVLLKCSFAYTKASIACVFRDYTKRAKGTLYLDGVFTQVGSFIGAITIFFILNYTHIFKSYNPCA